MGSKKHKKGRIDFYGTSVSEVTGSSYLIRFGGKNILIECGLHQSNNMERDFRVNSRNFKFRPTKLDYVFSLHLHSDHLGNIPKLYAEGCNARFIMPKKSNSIARIMLEDSAHIIFKDSEFLSKINDKIYKPFFNEEDVNKALNNLEEYELEKEIKLDDCVSFKFIPSQHIIGSAQLLLILNDGHKKKTILYTSDLGNIKFGKTHYCDDFKSVKSADIVIGETTYNNPKRSCRRKKDREKDIEKIKSAIEQFVIENKSKLLIPAFALHRSQIMLKIVYDLFKNRSEDFDVILDSPMANKITQEFSELLEGKEKFDFDKMLKWKRLKIIKDWETSSACIQSDRPMVIISASGMMSAGRSVNYAQKIIENENACIMIAGYASPNTLAGIIKEGKKSYIKINGKAYKNSANLIQLRTMSSHMQYDDLLDYYSSIYCKEIYLVHGNQNDKYTFAETLQEKIYENNMTSKVYIPLDYIEF